MLWIITVDHVNQAEGPNYANSKVGSNRDWKIHFKAATAAEKIPMLEEIKSKMTHEFRLFDDDGELYYEGMCKDLDDQDGDSAFEPLDWAADDAGCTTMQYRKIGMKQWNAL